MEIYLYIIILLNIEKSGQTDDDLLALDEEGFGLSEDNERSKDVSKTSDYGNADRMRADVVSFLKKMMNFLQKRTKDETIHGVKNGVGYPCLMDVAGLNVASAHAVASCAVVYMMNKYGLYIRKRREVRDLLLRCSGIFLALYANKLPSRDTLRNRKIRELLLDATVHMLSALSFFGYEKNDCLLPQLILNVLEMWNGQKEKNDIIPLYKSQLQKLNGDNLNNSSIAKILKVASVYLSQETPIEKISLYHGSMYLLRKGYGFLIVDNMKRTTNGWSWVYHSPWFDDKIDNVNAMSFKGYYDL